MRMQPYIEIPKQVKEMSKRTRMIFLGVSKMKYKPLEDLIGIVKVRKTFDVEKVLDERGLDNAYKDLGF